MVQETYLKGYIVNIVLPIRVFRDLDHVEESCTVLGSSMTRI